MEMKTKISSMGKCLSTTNGFDKIFQKGFPIYNDKVNLVQATLSSFLVGGTTIIGLDIPSVPFIPIVCRLFFG